MKGNNQYSRDNPLFLEYLTEQEKEWYWVVNNQITKLLTARRRLVTLGHSRRHRKSRKKEAQCGCREHQ
jgi:hypothetical protein